MFDPKMWMTLEKQYSFPFSLFNTSGKLDTTYGEVLLILGEINGLSMVPPCE